MNALQLKKLNLPDKPGVYFFLKGKKILYIGKATSLRDRTRSYFGKDLVNTRGAHVADMVLKAGRVDWQATDSVLEALILEANLIKKFQPYYNTQEKDDKSFNYVGITKDVLPKVVLIRGRELAVKGGNGYKKIFGPFPHGGQLKEALKIVRKIFPFLDDKSKNYLEFYRQINLAPDVNDRTLYMQNIRNIVLFFSGKKTQILKNLKKEMTVYAKVHEFERASEVKRQYFALKHINDVALLKNGTTSGQHAPPQDFLLRNVNHSEAHAALPTLFRIEAYDIAHIGGKSMVGVMTVVENGEPAKSEYRKFSARGGSAFGGKTVLGDSKANDVAALREVLERRLNHQEWQYPNLIVMDGGAAQLNVAQKVLHEMDMKIDAVSVVKDDRHAPKAILGREDIVKYHKSAILLANSEAHRFAITYHKKTRNKNFLA